MRSATRAGGMRSRGPDCSGRVFAMSEPAEEKSGPEQFASVFLRIELPVSPKDRVAVTFLEIDPEGHIPREIGLAEDATPVYVTRPGEYGRWNDSPMPRTPPGTAAFEEQWGRLGLPISAADFEAVYARADATLPHTVGGTPVWVSDLVSWTVGLIILALVVGAIAIVLAFVFGAISGALGLFGR